MNPGEQETPEEQIPSSYGTPPPPPIGPPSPIQWNLLFRLASPLAVITGVMSYLIFPVGLLLVLPFSLKRIITRYRPLHTGALPPGRGAVIGVFMGLLSFIAFLVFFFATLSVRRAYVLDKIHQWIAQAPDAQSRQLAQWFATSQGLALIIASAIFFSLALFLIAGALSGAWITRTKKAGSHS
ncbi:MAG TPA: hypothetical protein VFP71_11960 [Candidatus Angelobacter sp.]|nr:hypothetical protein [Candidatus Angelobacter sp.]